jgi:hypothetical protein
MAKPALTSTVNVRNRFMRSITFPLTGMVVFEASLFGSPREMFRIGRGQQALFALVDALTKGILTCVPEPPAEATQQAVARAKLRYARLMQNAGGAMAGETKAAMQDLVGHVSEDDERPVRLRPRKPTAARGRSEGIAWATGYKLLMHMRK